MNYKEQNTEIQRLLKRIGIKSKNFSDKDHDSEYYEDLVNVINGLKNIDHFLDDLFL